ncbi:hypothetical protein Pcinc_016653 [Petrolisthes cinctipes]|uniref:Uncharacterized protein n=1 Tax=Petrolisthes cinctipes TaxID=88211 RepID=A0AAE1KLK7_PETCI|nr:hypothetical protein Pcinc_016653 [Petrolisthes cinctipes]
MNYSVYYRPWWLVCVSRPSAYTCITTHTTRLKLTCINTHTTRLHHTVSHPLYNPGYKNDVNKKVRQQPTSRSISEVITAAQTTTTTNTPPSPLPNPTQVPTTASVSQSLMNYFDISMSKSHKIIKSETRLKNCDIYTVEANIFTLKKYGLDPEQVQKNLSLLYRKPVKIEHDIAILKELGFINLCAQDYLIICNIFKSLVVSLKNCKMLPEHYDPIETMLVGFGLPSHRLPSQLRPSQLDLLTIQEVHILLSNAFLCWQLDCSEEVVKKMKAMYNLNRKSITLQRKIIQDLDSYWNIDTEKVMRNPYILSCSPTNITHIATRVRKIAEVDLKELVFLTPRILAIPYHQLIQIDTILTSLDVTQAAVRAIPWVCTLKPETIEERINLLEQIPELGVLKSHPRVLRLIVYYKKVLSRLAHLQQVKNSSAVPSLNKLAGHNVLFDKYVKVGNSRRESRDIITFISEYFGVTRIAVRNMLHTRCWGPQTNVLNIKVNLAHLVDKGFTKRDLFSALDVVLYPPDFLKEQLSKLPHRPQVQTYLSNKILLYLLLYYMDKSIS